MDSYVYHTRFKITLIAIITLIMVFCILLFLKKSYLNRINEQAAKDICQKIMETKFIPLSNLNLMVNSSSASLNYITVNISGIAKGYYVTSGYCTLNRYYRNKQVKLVSFRLQNQKKLYLYNNVTIKLINE